MVRHEEITLNIGIPDGHTALGLCNKLEYSGVMEVTGHKVTLGEWNNEKERTLVVTGFTSKKQSHVVDMLERIAFDLQEDCIAVSTSFYDALVYRHGFQGDKQKFNKEYFWAWEEAQHL